jgi:hypothetical protein
VKKPGDQPWDPYTIPPGGDPWNPYTIPPGGDQKQKE